MLRAAAAALLMSVPVATAQPRVDPPGAEMVAVEPHLTAAFEAWMKEAHVPGLVYGVVRDGRLVVVRGLGVQELEAKRPVTAETRFRIASMSKAFTAMAILKLRDEGKLSLDAPAERYVPELREWRYPTADSRRITVGDLLHHTAGFVDDNPWGDRQQAMLEAVFSALLEAGVPFAQAPGVRMEYSNLGYAILGRIITNVSSMPYQDYVRRTLLAPLGMGATSYDVFASPKDARALGYRWQDEAWLREPDMADGAFGAMGGMETSASDYARWAAFLLSAWPAREGPEAGPVSRTTVREIVEGSNYVRAAERPRPSGEGTCRAAVAYAKGWNVLEDCELGRVVIHTGGYPGYGSVVMLLPDAGVGVFAFANRTYGAPSVPVGRALWMLRQAGLAAVRPVPVSDGLARGYAAAKAVWQAGDASRAPLAENVLLDRDAAHRRADIAALKAKVGACTMGEAIVPVSAMEGSFTWSCASGRVFGRVRQAPTPELLLQLLEFREAAGG
jgi:CubicO group peptidase (beta-lactamase class C family)